MSAAVLFRGHAHREPGSPDRPWGINWKLCIDSHRRHLLEPLRAQYGDVDVFLASYLTPHRDAVLRDYEPKDASLWVQHGTQRSRTLDGLDLVAHYQIERVYAEGRERYQLVAVCRFDVELLCCPLDLPGFDASKVNLLWRELEEDAWKHHNRVGDPLHLFPGELLEVFRAAVAENLSDHCLHLVWRHLANRVGEERLNLLLKDGYFNSNSDVTPNPIYRLVRT